MSWWQVIVLAIVEGLTEFLPVSSTGHMILASSFWHESNSDFTKSFMIIIQLGAILAVVSKYWQLVLSNKKLWVTILAAFIPTAVIGLLLYKIEKHLFLDSPTYTLFGLAVGGVVLILVPRLFKRDFSHANLEDLPVMKAGIIGLVQSLAIIPGVSRSACSILAGMTVGLARKEAVEFSFLLAVPVMAAATGLDLVTMGFSFTSVEWGQLLFGLFVAFVVARLSVDWFVRFVEKHSFAWFGWYRLGLVGVYLLLRRFV